MTAIAADASSGRRDAAFIQLWIAGAALLALAAAGPWIVQRLGYAVFIPALAASGSITIAATALAPAIPTRRGLMVILGLGLVIRLVLVAQEPLLSTDLYRYVWDGRVQAAGINPYAHVPADPALAALRDEAIYPHINRADYAVTAYPPVAQLFFLAVTRIAESITAMRLAMIGCEIMIVAVLIDLLRRFALPVTAVVAYAWHPLAIFEVASSAHVEALMVALLLLGVWLLVATRTTAGAIAITLAALVKPYAVLVLPAFWRRWDWRVPLAVIATIILCYLPYRGAGADALGFLGKGYVAEEGLLSGDGIWLVALVQAVIGSVRSLTIVYLVAAAAIMGWLGLRVAFAADRSPRATVADVTLLLTVGLFLLSPNYAWYFLALVPFIALGAGAPVWALTLGAFLLYRPALLPYNELAWKTLATLPFLIALPFWLRTRARHAQGAST